MQFSNQEFKVVDAATLGTDGTEVSYIPAELFKGRIIERTEQNSIDTKI